MKRRAKILSLLLAASLYGSLMNGPLVMAATDVPQLSRVELDSYMSTGEGTNVIINEPQTMTGGVTNELPTRNVHSLSVQVAPGTTGGEASTKTFIPHYFAGIPAYTTYFYIPAPNENTGVDKTPLFEKIADASVRIESGLYTKESTDGLQAVLKEALAVYQSAEAQENDLQAAIANIESGVQKLEAKPVDISGLEQKLEEAKQIVEADYTPESYGKLIGLVTEAESYLKGTSHTDNVTAGYILDIDAAIKALVKLDKEALKSILDEAAAQQNPKNEGTKQWEEHEYTVYTRKSWNAFQQAKESADKLFQNDPKVPTQNEVNEAVSALRRAMDALLPYNLCDERDSLKAILDEAKGYKNDPVKYDADTFETLQKAIEVGEDRLDYASLTFPERDGFINDIRLAIQGLKEISVTANKTALAAAIKEAEGKKQAGYTAASWNTMQTALAEAKEVNSNTAATQAQVDTAAKALQNAIKALKAAATAVKPGTPSSVKAVWAGAKKVKITWKKASKADKYIVYRSSKKSSGYKKVGETKGTSLTDKNALTGKTSYYKVIAYNGKTKGSYSSIKSVYVLKAPVSVKAKASKKTVTVSFKKGTKASGYTIYRAAKKNGKYKKVATLKSAKTVKKRFTNMKKGTYYYKVKAYRKVSGKAVYTGYSSAVKVKVK